MRAALLAAMALLVSLQAIAAVRNSQFTATWDLPFDQTATYEFRWAHFAHPDWIALPSRLASTKTFTATFEPLPAVPATDRWMCLDSRSLIGGVPGPWLSQTKGGAACNSVEVGTIAMPPPPIVPPPTPPQPPPPTDLFSNLTNSKGVLSFDYQLADCRRGVQQTTGPISNGSRTITLTCRK